MPNSSTFTATMLVATAMATLTVGCESSQQTDSPHKSARQCGTITVSDHFAAWKAQGWKLGGVTSIHINSEVGGGTGKIDFSVANITTTAK